MEFIVANAVILLVVSFLLLAFSFVSTFLNLRSFHKKGEEFMNGGEMPSPFSIYFLLTGLLGFGGVVSLILGTIGVLIPLFS